ncbi:uncharacterized protein clmnb [Odontesthes bonariensis]|uniref:uncharacterized protein clmnb n=1 Tax=Odontesthes bonariensis TaxID=219752 RepID=UPI003F588E5D
MRMQDNGDSQRKPAGVISDHNGQPEDEREAVQKRTFTRWMNAFLQRHDPPLEVHDLFTDIQDGKILMALLEELSGCKLLYRFRSSSHRIFRLNNISKALTFLDDRHVKLLGIDASGIADGIPSVVLNLIWNIILHFQVKEVTGGLLRSLSSSLSSLSLSCYPDTSDLLPQSNDDGSYSCNTLPRKSSKTAREAKYHGKAIKTLLQWVQRSTTKYGVDVHDFGKSWRSGLVFLAMIKSINPDLVDLRESLSKQPKENIREAFMIAHHSLDVPPLLEPEDVTCTSPDEQSIITYVSMFPGHHSCRDEDDTRDIEVPEIPNFGSLESVSFGKNLADDREAKALLKSFEKSSEQLLWRRWSRRSSGTSSATYSETNRAATSYPSSSHQRVLEPPSPLNAGVVNQEIRSWMEKGLDRGYCKQRVHESHLSLSSVEGIHSLSPLDSDEEDAYSYILDLNKDVFQPCKRQKVQKVEEETAEETKEESKDLEAFETFNGRRGKHQERSVDQDADSNLKSEVKAQSTVHRKFDLDENKSSLREMTNNRAVFVWEPEAERRHKENWEEERIEKAQIIDDSDHYEGKRWKKTENARKVKRGYDKTGDEAVKAKTFEVACWQQDGDEGGERELSEKGGHVSERRRTQKDLRRSEEGHDLKEQNESDEVCVKKREQRSQKSDDLESFKVNKKLLTNEAAYEFRRTDAARINAEEESDKREDAVKMDIGRACKNEAKVEETVNVMTSADFGPVKRTDLTNKELEKDTSKDVTTTANPGKTTTKTHADDIHEREDIRTPACGATPQSFREGRLIPHSLAVSCAITPFELEMLLVLWILLYCYLILPEMYL